MQRFYVIRKPALILATMLFTLLSSLWLLFGPFTLGQQSSSIEVRLEPEEQGLGSWLDTQVERSLRGIFDNIGPDGSKAQGASPGVVLASPSKNEPDYYYTWTRDAALVFKALTEHLVSSNTTTRTPLEPAIQDYITSQASQQQTDNPSGTLATGAGLGEPKFNPDLSAFVEPWGRPQRDGPALRATAMMIYAKHLLTRNQRQLVIDNIWPVVRNDLAYVGQYWNQTGFDLWEEVEGSSFFTLAAQYRALVEGGKLAAEIGKECRACALQTSSAVLCLLQTFWNEQFIVANVNQVNGNDRTGKDANSLLGVMHLFDPTRGCNEAIFQPCSSRALANHKQVVDSMRFYGINSGKPPGQAAAVGRYAEDVYQGGNPWYLTTLAAATQLYQAIDQWTSANNNTIVIDETSLAFFKDIYPAARLGTYHLSSPSSSSSSEFNDLIKAVRHYADGFVDVVRTYTCADGGNGGSLAEQFGKETGQPLSATDLTWSYAAVLAAAAAAAAAKQGTDLADNIAGWSSAVDVDLPGQCDNDVDGIVEGVYTPVNATEMSWPGRVARPVDSSSAVSLSFK